MSECSPIKVVSAAHLHNECHTCENMRCYNCKHWQGNRRSTEADCYYVVALLCSSLLSCKNQFGHDFRLPFDPHDAKYFHRDSTFWGMYNGIQAKHLPRGVRMEVVRELDMYFPEEMSDDALDHALSQPKVGRSVLKFFRTEQWFCCEFFERR